MARGLGIIDDQLEEDLNWLRAIRNSFAHSVDDVTLESPGIVSAMTDLAVKQRKGFQDFAKKMEEKGVEVSPLSEYIFFIIEIIGAISKHFPRRRYMKPPRRP